MSIKNVLSKTTIQLLKPLVRILLRFGISHKEFAELAKKAYVDVSYRYYGIPGRKQTFSRVAVITGLSRKEVVRLHQESENEYFHVGPINRASRVIGGWLRDVDFQDKHGNPKPLPLMGALSFQTLVKRYSGDITARAVLDELLRSGAVEKTDNKTIVLKTEGYIPHKNDEDKIRIMGISVQDLLSTIHENLNHPHFPLFQREVIYTDLPDSVVDEFKQYSHDKGLTMLLDLNHWLADKKQNVKEPSSQSIKRIGMGVYYFQSTKENNDKE